MCTYYNFYLGKHKKKVFEKVDIGTFAACVIMG